VAQGGCFKTSGLTIGGWWIPAQSSIYWRFEFVPDLALGLLIQLQKRQLWQGKTKWQKQST
jgi:hypothetical protein